jgi:hypothetical protein
LAAYLLFARRRKQKAEECFYEKQKADKLPQGVFWTLAHGLIFTYQKIPSTKK